MLAKPVRALFAAAALFATALLTACFESGGSLTNLPESEFANVSLQIRLGRVDATAPVGGEVDVLSKRADGHVENITLRHMVLRFTSNLNDTTWDTTLVNSGVTTGDGQGGEQTVNINIALPPLRWWNIEIKTEDLRDSIIHYGVVGPVASRGGQTVALNIPLLNSRFTQYEAQYQLPAEIYPANVPVEQRVYQKIFFSRLELAIDGVVVRDTTSFSPAITDTGTRFITAGGNLRGAAGKFFFRPHVLPLDTMTHVQYYPYVRTGPRTFRIRAFGYLEGDSVGSQERLLFEGSQPVTLNPGAVIPPIPMQLDYKGDRKSVV